MIYNKRTHLENKLRTFIVFNLISLIILLYSLLHHYQLYHKQHNKLKILEYNSQDLSQTLENINYSLDIIDEAKKFSDAVNSSKNIANGIQYTVAKERIQDLVNYYKIYPSSTFIASKQIDIPNLSYDSTAGKFNLVGAFLKLSINAGTDLQIIQFLETMTNYFPGYLKIEYLRLKKMTDIDAEILEDVKNKINRTTVSADIGLEWYDFKKND